MSQTEVMQILIKNKGKEFTVKQLARRIKKTNTSVLTSVNRLIKFHPIEIREEKMKRGPYKFKIKYV